MSHKHTKQEEIKMNQLMTNEQYNILKQYNEVASKIIEAVENDSQFEDLIVVSDISKVEDIEIYDLIEQYENGETKDTAVIGISNTMAVVIIEAGSDSVFGYIPYDDGKRTFFLSEIEYKQSDIIDDDFEPMFTIGEDGMELSLNDAMRIGR